MLKLAAFADEISPDLDEQIRVCRANGVTHFELRGVNHQNVLDFDPPLRDEIRRKLADQGMGVISIASPIGKVKVSDPWGPHFDRFKIAVELAEFFAAPFIRLFSYYPPESAGKKDDVLRHRDEVMRRMRAKVEYVRGRPVTLAHENEKDIFGEKGAQCLDLMKTIDSPQLRGAFDFANFVQAGEDPRDNWPLLRPFTAHIHVKDALRAGGPGVPGGRVVPAGEGDGQIEPILADAWGHGYRGFLSLEPHLKVAGHSHGETGEALFKVAADALKALCRRAGVPLERK